MAGFAGWNFLGTAAGVLKNQGIDIIVNIFFGVTLNAARGIATQVNVAVTKFTQSFMTAMKPQITKSYAQEDFNRLHFLITQGAKYSFYLILFLSIPIILEMDTLLALWLKKVPDYAVPFARIQLLETMFTVLSNTLIFGLLSTGTIKRYQIIVGTLSLCNFPIRLS